MRPSSKAAKRALFGSAALLAGALGLAGASAAQTPGDGTPQPAYRGPYLTWAGKSPAQPAAAQLESMPTPAQEFASWPAPAASRSPARAARAAPQAARYAAPWAARSEPASAAEAGPSDYAARQPRSAAAAYVAPPAPTAALPPSVPAQAAASPQTARQNSATPKPPTQKLASNDAGAAQAGAANTQERSHVRFYSLHRAYGLTPDPVVMPKNRPMVLIGPPDDPPAQAKSDSGDKSDQQGASEGADD